MYTQIASPKAWKQITPMTAPPRCPPKTALGWAAAARVRQKRNTVVPPIEASRKGAEEISTNHRAVPIAIAAPMAQDIKRPAYLVFILIPVFVSGSSGIMKRSVLIQQTISQEKFCKPLFLNNSYAILIR
jgi:hypothetical protein